MDISIYWIRAFFTFDWTKCMLILFLIFDKFLFNELCFFNFFVIWYIRYWFLRYRHWRDHILFFISVWCPILVFLLKIMRFSICFFNRFRCWSILIRIDTLTHPHFQIRVLIVCVAILYPIILFRIQAIFAISSGYNWRSRGSILMLMFFVHSLLFKKSRTSFGIIEA